MKIHNEDGISRSVSHASPGVKGGSLDPPSRTSGPVKEEGDRLELSDKARALLVASDAMRTLPHIQRDRIETLKQLIKDGKYRVPGEMIAERLLGEGIIA